MVDRVLHVYNATSDTVTNVGLYTIFPKVHNGLVGFTVTESQQGMTDLNGDSDTFDQVMHIFNESL